MTILGKLHEFTLYGVISTFVCIAMKFASLGTILSSLLHPYWFIGFFFTYMAWSLVLFLPLSLIGAAYTKYAEHGEALTFTSDLILIIMLGHIGEDILGLVSTPIWLLKDLFTGGFKFCDPWKIVDYILYFIEIGFILISFFILFH